MKQDDTSTIKNFQAEAGIQSDVLVEPTLAKVAENGDVLKCARNYLALCDALAQGKTVHSKEVVLNAALPSDLKAVENGVLILCSVYVQARSMQRTDICADIQKELTDLSGFYQNKVAQAYFSASNILLDAWDFKTDVLKKMHQCRDDLQNMHFSWPTDEDKSDLSAFFKKVDMYNQCAELEVSPEKRTSQVPLQGVFSVNFASNQRCA